MTRPGIEIAPRKLDCALQRRSLFFNSCHSHHPRRPFDRSICKSRAYSKKASRRASGVPARRFRPKSSWRAASAWRRGPCAKRRQGKGTYVATHTEEQTPQFRFLHIRRNDGEAEYPASRLLDVRRAKASIEAARLLDLKAGEAVILLRRVLEYAGTPTIFDEITLPAALFRGLTKAKYDAYHGSMYGFFETQFGVRMLKAQEKLRAVAADATAAAMLRVAIGTPLLAVDRVTFTYGDRPVELRRGLCSTRHHHYANELQ